MESAQDMPLSLLAHCFGGVLEMPWDLMGNLRFLVRWGWGTNDSSEGVWVILVQESSSFYSLMRPWKRGRICNVRPYYHDDYFSLSWVLECGKESHIWLCHLFTQLTSLDRPYEYNLCVCSSQGRECPCGQSAGLHPLPPLSPPAGVLRPQQAVGCRLATWEDPVVELCRYKQ